MKRSAGILLHPTCLPSRYGIGDLGPWSHKFADLLETAEQAYWQVLPLTPVGTSGSPYSPNSLFAGNSLLISPDDLVEKKILSDLPEKLQTHSSTRVDYASVATFKKKILDLAYKKNFEKFGASKEFKEFCARNEVWLEDYSLFEALRRQKGEPWYAWPEAIRNRDKAVLREKIDLLRDNVDATKFEQFLFDSQWSALKQHCKSKNLALIGDLPFYVSYDSSDVWVHRNLFKLDNKGRPEFVGGVPPDYFSETGQLWGNPVYDWETMKENDFKWWKDRISRTLELFDITRLDHFRGYLAYWEIPAEEKTAVKGEWVKTPESFLRTLSEAFPKLPFIAEDLGVITSDVRDVIQKLGIPGMEVLVFAFDGSLNNPYLPRNHIRNSVVYTGTHDTNTARGWFEGEATEQEKAILSSYIGGKVTEGTVASELVKLAMMSVSDLCVIPLQDHLGLGTEARMNDPAVSENNWQWRVDSRQLSRDLFQGIGKDTLAYGRA